MRAAWRRLSDRVSAVWSVLDGWDRLTLLATAQLFAGLWIVFGLGIALIAHGALWLVLGLVGARGAEVTEMLRAKRQAGG